MKLRWLACSICCLTFAAGWAADLPRLVLPQGVGVNIHFSRGHERDLDMIAAAGFKFVRMDLGWGGIERQKGIYNWGAYDELVANLEQRGLGAIFILDYSNGLYEKDASPQHPESVAAFARWAGAAAAHFKGHRILWEIWNEPNISFWKPKPDVHQYITLAKATCRAVREQDPHAMILAPASSTFPWEFFETMFKAGLLEQLDAVSVHPYRNYQRGPETAAEDYLRLRSLIERYAPKPRRFMPIISGEWGYATHDKGVSLETQAAFVVRQQNLLARVPLSIWYDWKNDGPNPADAENNFGTVYQDLRPKPAYEAIQTMTRQLAGYRIAHRLDVGKPEAYVLLLVNAAGDQKLAAWSTRGEPEIRLDLGLDSPGSVTLIDGYGKPKAVRLRQQQLELSLSALPVYATLKERSARLTAAAAWEIREPLLRSVTAGSKNALVVPLTIRNPFAQKVTAEANLAVPGSAEPKTITLGPGKTTGLKLACAIFRQDVSRVPATLTVTLQDAAGQPIGSSAEHLEFCLANPLRLTVAPATESLRVTVEDIAGASFNGALELGNQKRSVQLSSANPVATAEFGLPNSSSDIAAGPFSLISRSGQLTAQIPPHRFHRIPVTNYFARLDGDAKVSATAAIHSAASPGENPPCARVFALDYQFAKGWRFVRCEAGPSVQLEPRPKALGLWVYGDNSGNALRARVRDASGQTFQPSGPNLNWTGWRWVTFDLEDLGSAGHWGGANDGVVNGSLTLDTPLLLDGTRRKSAGRIYFCGLTTIY